MEYRPQVEGGTQTSLHRLLHREEPQDKIDRLKLLRTLMEEHGFSNRKRKLVANEDG
jgi:hypothetical protein